MSQNPPLAAYAPTTITVEHVDLLSVTGQLDGHGLDHLQGQLHDLLDGGSRSLLMDLSGVVGCDGRLFDLLARTKHRIGQRGGWLRLVGLGAPVMEALSHADLPEVLLVYRAARWSD